MGKSGTGRMAALVHGPAAADSGPQASCNVSFAGVKISLTFLCKLCAPGTNLDTFKVYVDVVVHHCHQLFYTGGYS